MFQGRWLKERAILAQAEPHCSKSGFVPARSVGYNQRPCVPPLALVLSPMEALGGERLVLSVETKHDMTDSAWHCVIQSGHCAVLHVPEIWNCHIARASSVTVKDFTVSWRDEVIQIEVDPKGGALLIHPSVSKGPLRCAEFFAGITGWSQALEAFGVEPLVLVERDTCVAN